MTHLASRYSVSNVAGPDHRDAAQHRRRCCGKRAETADQWHGPHPFGDVREYREATVRVNAPRLTGEVPAHGMAALVHHATQRNATMFRTPWSRGFPGSPDPPAPELT